MHLEPAPSELDFPVSHSGKSKATVRSDVPASPREGLPAAFKMRREKHYVEQLLGDAPLRTVREIPLHDIDPPADESADIEPLRQSVKALGVLQPLLVAPAAEPEGGRGGLEPANRFQIISGVNRFRAARALNLRTVPCLVCETAAHTADELRAAATQRAAPPALPEVVMPDVTEAAAPPQPQPQASAGLRDVTARLAFVSAVMPALDAAEQDPLRWSILTDLMKVEMERARSTAAAIEWLSGAPSPRRETVDAASVFDAVLDAVGPEARLSGVKLEVSSSLGDYQLPLDRTMVVRALTALVQGMLSLSPAGSTLRLDGNGTTVRPALIVDVIQEAGGISEAAAERFFDAAYAEHPLGEPARLALAGVAQVARLHGGRVSAHVQEGRGCGVTFVVPRPIAAVDEATA